MTALSGETPARSHVGLSGLADAELLQSPHQKTRFLPRNYRTEASKKHNRRKPPIRQKNWATAVHQSRRTIQ
jgi:hypothetical protein